MVVAPVVLHATDNKSAVLCRCLPSTKTETSLRASTEHSFQRKSWSLLFVRRCVPFARCHLGDYGVFFVRFVVVSLLLPVFFVVALDIASLAQNFAFASVTHTQIVCSSRVCVCVIFVPEKKCCSSAPSGLFDITRLLDCSDGSVVQCLHRPHKHTPRNDNSDTLKFC